MISLRPIEAVADEFGVERKHVLPWGRHRAKIDLQSFGAGGRAGRLILVSAINPTPAGEGKTTTSVALAMGLRRRGRRVVAALREPSLGPVFGIKGGGTGGGQAMLEPADQINLHSTSDFHLVTAAHNLLAALVDNAVYFEDPVAIEAQSVRLRRVLDVNDRFLRRVIVGLGGKSHGVPRESGFDITAASEVMAILCLASGHEDLEARLGRIVVGQRADGSAVRAREIFAAAPMAALLRDSLLPNLVQTREGGPALIHGGPFGNIAHGCSSVLSTRLAMDYADEVVTEAGFGFDLGGEKFLDIKCRTGGIWPRLVVLVTTLRALKFHGGVPAKQAGAPDAEALRRGFDHLAKHLESVAFYGLPALVAVNRFPADTDAEIDELRAFAADRGVPVAVSDGFARGGEGALELADRTLEVLAKGDAAPPRPRFAYEVEEAPEQKILKIAQRVYGADDVHFTPGARADLEALAALGGAQLPVCMAKTHLSLSDDPTRQGRPRGFTITVREVRLSAGAGFIVPLTGEIMTMPGLPRVPAARKIVVREDGTISGLMQED